LGQLARNSSTRAYAGHSSEFRKVFDMKSLNLTEYARSFGLYKQLYFAIQQDKRDQEKDKKRKLAETP